MQKSDASTLLLLLGVLFWGMTFSFIKEAVQFVDAFSFISVRFFIASFILTIIFWKKLKNYSVEVLKTGIFIGLLLAISMSFQVIGIQFTTASNAGFIAGMGVVFVLIFVSIIDKKMPKFLQVISVLLAFAGLALVAVNTNMGFNIGDIWVFFGAVIGAFHLIGISKLVHKIDASLFALTQFYTVAFFCLIIGLIVNGEIIVSQNFVVWQAILFCALFATVYMFTIQAHFQRFLTEIKTSIIFAFEPIFAALFAVIYLGEILSLKVILGGLMIFIAMMLSEIKINFKQIITSRL